MALHPDAPGCVAALRTQLAAMLRRMPSNGTSFDDAHRARIAEAVEGMVSATAG